MSVKLFGTDLSAVPGLNVGTYNDGTKNLAEALLRRSISPPGSLFYDADYGVDIREYLLETLDELAIYEIKTLLSRQYLQDPRVVGAQVSVREELTSVNGKRLKISAVVETQVGVLDLVIAVSNITAEILSANLTSLENN